MLAKVAISGQQHIVWLEGISTRNLADDEAVAVNDDEIFVVTGNRTYTTVVGGSKTVMELHRLTEEEASKLRGLLGAKPIE